MTNNRAIHSAATSEAKTLTHQDSTTSKLAIAAPRTSQSSKNQITGVATPGFTAKGCSSFWKRKRDLSTGNGAAVSGVGREISGVGTEDVCTQCPVCTWKDQVPIIRRERRPARTCVRRFRRQATAKPLNARTPQSGRWPLRGYWHPGAYHGLAARSALPGANGRT